ncbi:conserved hypothetical protein, membrane [Candidatus Magnetomorum sp. HK-1]|nr:conserved hypothetical protein, membrane [Candidatus Magnetomorum sp. HK-1]
MEQPPSHEIIRFGLFTLVKLALFFFVVLIIISVFLVTMGWVLTMAFSEFELFEATMIPLLVLGFTTMLVGLISIWIRLGEIVYVLDPDGSEFDEDDLENNDYFYDEDDIRESEISSLKRPTKITPIYKNRMRDNSKKINDKSSEK